MRVRIVGGMRRIHTGIGKHLLPRGAADVAVHDLLSVGVTPLEA